jgi:1-acyl-sn-glycerol-3-phosphate acyltransferase
LTPTDILRRAAGRALGPLALPVELWADGVSDLLGLVRGSIPGDDLDEWDPGYIRRTLGSLWAALSVYFRPDVRGLGHIPVEGPALLVGNHSGGTLIADSFILAAAFYRRFGPDRRFHQLTHDVAARLPGLALLRRYGALRASHENAKRAFELGAPVLVYPGGDWETFRPSWRSSEVDLAGRTGFVKLALEQQAPVVPIVAIGGQETALFVTRGERLARLLMVDRLLRIRVLPVAIAPPFGISILDLPPRLPLPAQVTIQVLPAIDVVEEFGADADPDEVYRVLEDRMQEALDALAEERDLPVIGPLRAPTRVDGAAKGGGARAAEERESTEAEPTRAGNAGEPAARGVDAVTGDGEASEGFVEPSPAAAWLPRTPRRTGAAGPGRNGRPDGAATTAPRPTDAPPQEDTARAPVREEDALVAEYADEGAAEGAGAELHVDEPWEGYRKMRVAEVTERLRGATPETLAAVRLYEQVHKHRRGVLTAVERELKRS